MSILSSAVKIVDKVGGSLKFKSRITVKSFNADAGKGDPTYTDKPYTAFVDKKQRMVRTFSGEEAVAGTTVTITKPGTLVKEHDVIVLADGSGGPVIGVGGYVDGSTQRQALTEAYLG